MKLLEEAIHEQLPRMRKFNIQLQFIGDRSRLSPHLRDLMRSAEQETASFSSMTLTIAVSYGGMWDIAEAAKQIASDVHTGHLDIGKIDASLFGQYVSLNELPPVDLLIRTGGDYRLSNFLLWQAAYAELYFTETLWPEFSTQEFDHALDVLLAVNAVLVKHQSKSNKIKLRINNVRADPNRVGVSGSGADLHVCYPIALSYVWIDDLSGRCCRL